MRYTMNGKQVTKEEAYEEIGKMLPDGGIQYLDKQIQFCKENEIIELTLTIGTKGTLKIEF